MDGAAEELAQAVVQVLGNALLLALADLEHLSFQLLALGDVACNGRGAHDLAGEIPNRRDHQRDMNLSPVLARAHRLKMLDQFPTLHPLQNFRHFLSTLSW